MKKVESFELDHDKVTAPYVRKVKVMPVNPQIPECVITKYDIRFTQPNEEFMQNGAIHTLEHLFATFIREYTEDLIDISPMGCRTGFYCIFAGDKEAPFVAEIIQKALKDVLACEIVPATTRKECGNYKEHDLEAAKFWAQRFLSVSLDQIVNVYR